MHDPWEFLRKPPVQIAAAAAMLLIAVGILALRLFSGGSPSLQSPEVLMQTASSTGQSEAERSRRRKAARDLVQQAGEATDALRRLAVDSSDSAVRATALQGLGKARDHESVPLLIAALSDNDPHVRGQANAALIKIYEADLGFRAHDPPDKRAAAVAVWRKAIGK